MILYLSLFFVSLLGGSLVLLKKDRKYLTVIGLSFSGAYLLGVCLLHLIPELFENYPLKDHSSLGAFILLGFVLQLTLDYFSGGIEHGHVHVNNKLIGHFPWLVMISLCAHALIEAFPLYELTSSNYLNSYFLGLLLHKVPISFILVSLLIAYKLPNHKILFAIFIFAAMAPFGVYFGQLSKDAEMFSKLLALSVGIILHLSTTILLESNEEHKVQWKKLIPIFIGFGLAYVSNIFHVH